MVAIGSRVPIAVLPFSELLTPKTKPTIARRVRPKADCWLTARCRDSSEETGREHSRNWNIEELQAEAETIRAESLASFCLEAWKVLRSVALSRRL
jgi:hypothetical protein